MATADEFLSAFALDGIVTFPAAAVSSLQLAAEDVDWLTNVGLPRSAAPFLSFGSKGVINIPTVSELLGISGGARYRVIGSNGRGDPIAIDTAKSGEIVYLNHDNAFQRVFINSSVTRLADALLAYDELIAESQAAHSAEAVLDGEVSSESLRRFVSLIAAVDPPALESGMWADEIKQFEDEADAG